MAAILRVPPLRITQAELARRWKISPRTLERWRWLKQGPRYLKLGGRVVYRLEDIEAFEAEQLKGGAADSASAIDDDGGASDRASTTDDDHDASDSAPTADDDGGRSDSAPTTDDDIIVAMLEQRAR